MLRNELIQVLDDAISPAWGVIKWQMFAQSIIKLSQLEINIEDVLMYLPAAISSIHSILDKKSSPQLAFHSTLTIVHNLRGHRFLPYIDPKKGYHCNLSPAEDVFYHACMLAFVDDAVKNKFPTKPLNKAYDALSLLMKGGIAYSLYVALVLESNPNACKAFIPSLANSSVPAGTMFSLLSMWKFPFDHPEKYTKNQLLTYTAVMYMVSISAGLFLFLEFKTGNQFQREAAGKFFESYFIAGASVQGLNLVGDFLWEKMSRFARMTSWPKANDHEDKAQSTMVLAVVAPPVEKTKYQLTNSNVDEELENKNSQVNMPTSTPDRRVSFCQRFGKFALNVGSTVGAGLAIYSYMSPKP